MSILQNIIIKKYKEVVARQQVLPIQELEASRYFFRECHSLSKRIRQREGAGIIAEFKRASPSKGVINDSAEPATVASGYENGGASGMSVLTDESFFQGSGVDFVEAREACNLPLLRKDFILDEYQLLEAKAMGADVVLLIAAALTPFELQRLGGIAHQLGMEVLLEVHNQEELEKSLNPYVDLVGVNNRNLKSFEVSLETSLKLAELIPANLVKVAESGISSAENIRVLSRAGYKGFLIGEYFMKQQDPGNACRELIESVRSVPSE
ncbi:MAG: indole-3-glycerol phosphate synthase TrpC [Bacteroidota bacterium]